MARSATGEERADPRLTSTYDYELPAHLVARYPTPKRDGSRLLVCPRAGNEDLRDLRFSDLPSLLREGDLLVLNESRVLPARLVGRKPTGARCEVFLLRPVGASGPRGADSPGTRGRERGGGANEIRWEALVRPGSKLKPGREVVVSDELRVVIESGAPGGGRIIRLETELPIEEALERNGRIPLPPYLDREDESLDRDRYQTVYARDPGSVAAPTAGLHFTPELLGAVEAAGVDIERLTLHVGAGTFRPVEATTPAEHTMHEESWCLPEETAEAIGRTRAAGGRVWAVGTTVVRTLETAWHANGGLQPGRGDTDLFIVPGYEFRVIDGLITNFHLPRSTLLMLVSAFAGIDNVRRAYEHAIREKYRFYSYGDAMAFTPGAAGVES